MLGTCSEPLCVRSNMPERLGLCGTRCCANEKSLCSTVFMFWLTRGKKLSKCNFPGVSSKLLETVGPGPQGTPINQVNVNISSFSGKMVLQSDFLAVTRAEQNRRVVWNVSPKFLGGVSRQALLFLLRFASSEMLKWEKGLEVFS